MAEPSLRYVIVNLQGEMRTSRTEYLLGRNSRFESRDCRGYCDGDPTHPGAMQFQYGPLRALIQNRDLHYQFHVDLESRVYTSSRLSEYGKAKRIGRRFQASLAPTWRAGLAVGSSHAGCMGESQGIICGQVLTL